MGPRQLFVRRAVAIIAALTPEQELQLGSADLRFLLEKISWHDGRKGHSIKRIPREEVVGSRAWGIQSGVSSGGYHA